MPLWVHEEFKEKSLGFFPPQIYQYSVGRVHILNSGKGRLNKPTMGYNQSVNHAIGLEMRKT